MKDEVYVFQQDVAERSKTAQSAHKRTGTRRGTSFVSLPSDKLTKKGWESMNSEVKTYNLKSRLTMKEFSEMPLELRKTYLKNLTEEYNVGVRAIAEMFGMSKESFKFKIRQMGITGVFQHGGHGPTFEQKQRFDEFAGTSLSKDVEPVVSGNLLLKPVDYKTFRKLPNDQQRRYLQEISRRFRANLTMIAGVMGVSKLAFFNYVKEHGLFGIVPKFITREEKLENLQKWWADGGDPEIILKEEPKPQPVDHSEHLTEDQLRALTIDEVKALDKKCLSYEVARKLANDRITRTIETAKPQPAPAPAMSLGDVDFTLHGVINFDQLNNMLRTLVPENTDVIMRIVCRTKAHAASEEF